MIINSKNLFEKANSLISNTIFIRTVSVNLGKSNFSLVGFHVTSSPLCWWTEIVHCSCVIFVSRDWLQTMYTRFTALKESICHRRITHDSIHDLT